MFKKSKLTLGLVSALAACSFTASLQAHNDAAYSHDSGAVANNAKWLAGVDGAKKLSQLSLPGTHDTMSIRAGDAWQNQTMTLVEQLQSGIRVFDMRTKHSDDRFRMHHGVILQDTYFDDVLKDIDAFLAANPSETVVFRLSKTSGDNNSLSYDQVLENYLNSFGSKRWQPSSNNPSLDQIRGKFVILQGFSGSDSAGQAFGIAYGNLDIQDDFVLTTNWDLYNKWSAVKAHLNKAKNGNANTIYMNYLSGAQGSFPYFVVSGHSSPGTSAPRLATGLTTPGWKNSYPDFPRVNCFIGICTIAFEGTNTLTADYLASSFQSGQVAGMVMTDYPGKRFINNIIQLNNVNVYRELKDARTGKCLDFEGSHAANSKKAILWSCAGVAWQKWSYDASSGLLRNKANPAYCLDNMGQAYAGGGLHLWACDKNNANQRWDFVGNSLRLRSNHYLAVDAYGQGNGDKVGTWSHHGGSNQQWNWGGQ